MPSLPVIAGACVVALAAGTQSIAAWRAVAAFDGALVGNDAASLHRARYAGVRAQLPAGAFVELVREDRQLSAEERMVVELVAVQLHRCLAGLPMAPLPGIEAGFVTQIATGFRRIHSTADNADPAAVQRNLAAWWLGLSGDLHLSLARYALAPHVVTRGAAAWVVGDFPAAYDWRDQAARSGLEVQSDHGGGAVLFRRRP